MTERLHYSVKDWCAGPRRPRQGKGGEMSDIVERLRKALHSRPIVGSLVQEAADEIERLRGEVNLLKDGHAAVVRHYDARLDEVIKDRRECIDYWGKRAEKAEATIADLTGALLRYGHHDCDCRKTDTFPVEPCSCGWDAAIAAAADPPGEKPKPYSEGCLAREVPGATCQQPKCDC